MNKLYKLNVVIAFLLFCTQPSFSQTPCTDGMAGIYPCDNVDLLAFVPLEDIGGGDNTNDIWGWVSPNTGKEYAIVGCNNGTAFVDVSNPVQPVYLGLLPTHSANSLWRDMETYNNYCFIVSEASFHGLQVFDMLQLDNVTNPPVDFDESAHYDDFGHCHTLSIDPVSGFCYCNGTGTYEGGLHIVDISDPLNPTLAGGFGLDGYTHDCFSWTYDGPDPDYAGKQIVFACNEDELTIVDVTDKTDCQAIESYSYADVGYIHQGWISKDKSYFMLDDELDEGDLSEQGNPTGTRTHLFDVHDLDNAEYLGFYESDNPSIDHNLYVEDQFVYESNYRSGVRVLDAVHVSDGTLNEVGYFDLYPANDFIQYSGTWSNYPYLPSGINLATDMYGGFFILQPSLINLSQSTFDLCGVNEIILEVEVNAELAFPLTIALEGISNVSLSAAPMTEPGTVTVTISDLLDAGPGTYYATIALQTNFGEQYEVPLTITLSAGTPVAPALLAVPDNSFISNSAESVLFDWVADPNTTSYTFELATDEAFSDIIETQNTSLNSYLLTFNLPDGTYYWRVKGMNECGTGQWSAVYQFAVTFVNVIELGASNLQVFPNPASETLYINGLNDDSIITISDMSGREVKRFGFNHAENVQLNISELSSGSYLLRTAGTVVRFVKK